MVQATSPRTSPRKRVVAINDKQSSRQPSRCSKCEGRPLRSQCPHTTAGRYFIDNQRVSKKQRHCLRCPGKPLQSQCLHTAKGRAYLDVQRAQAALRDITILTDEALNPSGPEVLITSGPTSISSSVNPLGLPGCHTVENAFSADVFYPLLGDSSTTSPTMGQSSSPDTSLSLWAQPSPSFQTPDSTSSPATSEDPITPSPSAKRIPHYARKKATKKNPIHGLIQGAKRGNEIHETYRTRRLPKPLDPSSDMSGRFLRQINKILQKCEDISTETGCWLYLGAQHVTARAPPINYGSARLCREAKPSADKMAELFNATVSHLLRARRTDAVTLQCRLDEAEERKTAAEKKAQEAKALLEEYQKKFGVLDRSMESHSQ